jgi:hypothetical protein
MEEAESIDYKRMYEHMVNELEQARIAILDLRRKQNMLGNVSGDSIRAWVNRNYIVIVVGVMLTTVIVSSIKTLLELFNTRGNNGSQE